MPVPSGAYAMKKLAGAVLDSGPSVSIVQKTLGTCDFQNPAQSCLATAEFNLDNPNGALVSGITWSTVNGTITAGQNTETITVTNTSGVDQADVITCNLTIDGEPTTLTQNTVYLHTDTSTPINTPVITRDSGGSCDYAPGETCQATSTYSVAYSDGNGTPIYEWSITGDATFVELPGDNATAQVIGTNDDTDDTYTLSCTITDNTGTVSDTQVFNDIKSEVTQSPISRITTIYSTTTNDANYNIEIPPGENRIAVIMVAGSGTTNGLNRLNNFAPKTGPGNIRYYDESLILDGTNSMSLKSGYHFLAVYSGVDQTTPFTTRTTASGFGTTASVDITGMVEGARLVMAINKGASNASSIGTNTKWKRNSGTWRYYLDSTETPEGDFTTVPSEAIESPDGTYGLTTSASASWSLNYVGMLPAGSAILNTDDDNLPDEELVTITVQGVPDIQITEDEDSVNIDLDGDGVADIVIPKTEEDE